jgi:hypothetical protein
MLAPGSDGSQLAQRVRPVLGDPLPVGKGPEGSRQLGLTSKKRPPLLWKAYCRVPRIKCCYLKGLRAIRLTQRAALPKGPLHELPRRQFGVLARATNGSGFNIIRWNSHYPSFLVGQK